MAGSVSAALTPDGGRGSESSARDVGRTGELEILRRLIGKARSGRSAVLVVRGEPGIGNRATLTVYLSVIIRQETDGWRIMHYQVSRLDSRSPKG